MSFRSLALVGAILFSCCMQAADLDPKAIRITAPDQLKWVENAEGYASAVVRGDPNQPGEYAMLVKWHKGRMSHPHYHPNDRFITVISGTWWVGTGTKFEPEGTKPVAAGSFVVHPGKQVHYDGAKDQDVILQIIGMGPGTLIPADKK